MEQKKMARRQFGIATAGLGTLAALPVCSGAEGLVSPDTQSFGQLHRKLVDEGLEWLGGKPILSSSGLKKLVDHLHKLGLIDQSESDMLYAIVDQLASATLEALRKVVLGFLEKIRQAAALMKAILGIVKESIDWCLSIGQDLPPEDKKTVVLKDLYGSLQGASLGVAVGAALGGVAVPILAAIGALGGSITSSLDAANDARNRLKNK